jgi:succinate dehydrogenase flavin-adding protein (antitoxin of CptAB toxin-antitoxin module)
MALPSDETSPSSRFLLLNLKEHYPSPSESDTLRYQEMIAAIDRDLFENVMDADVLKSIIDRDLFETVMDADVLKSITKSFN